MSSMLGEGVMGEEDLEDLEDLNYSKQDRWVNGTKL